MNSIVVFFLMSIPRISSAGNWNTRTEGMPISQFLDQIPVSVSLAVPVEELRLSDNQIQALNKQIELLAEEHNMKLVYFPAKRAS